MRIRSGTTITVDVCVCTYRRRYLEETLRSIGALALPSGLEMRVIVADNDIWPSARKLVEAVAPELPCEVSYIHCPASNISLARNACLDAADGDLLAFVDDDSTVSPEWLAALLESRISTGADAVLGPVISVYAPSAPDWMKRGDFHSTKPVWVNGEIRTGYSGNVLLDRASPHVRGRRFNLELGRSGGEDTEYFSQLHQSGGRIAYASGAIAHEPVTESRQQFSWLAKRRFRSGQTHGRLVATGHAVLPQACLAAGKSVLSFAAALAMAPFAHLRNRQMLRGVMHAGVVSGLFGVREIQLYGGDTAERRTHAA